MTKSDSEKFSKALAFASLKHADQQRKDGTPYIFHPIRVAMYLSEKGYDVRYQIGGLFHDLLEDTDVAEEELREFGDEEMLQAIKLVTKDKKNGFDEAEYINRILAHPMAKAIKNADRIDNFKDMFKQDNQAFVQRYIQNTKEYFYGKFSDELDCLVGIKGCIND